MPLSARDPHPNTQYFVDTSFKDFEALDLDAYTPEKVLCFFDDHQNAARRLQQCLKKKVKHVCFNDNYPKGLGSHFSVQHMLDGDVRNVFELGSQLPWSINTLAHVSNDEKVRLLGTI